MKQQPTVKEDKNKVVSVEDTVEDTLSEEENIEKDTISEDYPRSLKSNREKWLEKYGKHLHPQSNKSFAFR